MRRAVALTLALAIPATAVPLPAFAKTTPEEQAAAALVTEAKARASHGDKAGAIERWEQAYTVSGAPSVGLELARAEADAGHLVRAMTVWRDVATTALPDKAPAEDAQAVGAAARSLPDIEAKVPRVRVALEGVDASAHPTVKLSGQIVPAGAWLAVDPGSYKIEASAEGKPSATKDVTLAQGARQTITLSLAPPPPPKPVAAAAPKPEAAPAFVALPPRHAAHDEGPVESYHPSSGQKSVGIIVIGAGVIGLGAGAVTGLLAMNQKSQLDSSCTDFHCPPSSQADYDNAKKLALVSTIGFVAGGVLTVGGIVLVLTAPKHRAVSLSVGPGSAHLTGSF